MWKKGLTLFLLFFLYLSLLNVFADIIPEVAVSGEDIVIRSSFVNRLPEFVIVCVALLGILHRIKFPCTLYQHLRTFCSEWKRKD